MRRRKPIIVRKKDRGNREARGLSRKELKEAGSTVKQALCLGLPVDMRRRSYYKENVRLAKQYLKDVKTSRVKPTKTSRKPTKK
ncbi:MAG: ribosomal protein L13e [Candidatus Bathyarchaeota archaeon]|nr:MAG: ribosomal protein L13e [Candidatus Bathyarchaeota archaeon]